MECVKGLKYSPYKHFFICTLALCLIWWKFAKTSTSNGRLSGYILGMEVDKTMIMGSAWATLHRLGASSLSKCFRHAKYFHVVSFATWLFTNLKHSSLDRRIVQPFSILQMDFSTHQKWSRVFTCWLYLQDKSSMVTSNLHETALLCLEKISFKVY